jgi:hypothetical protein
VFELGFGLDVGYFLVVFTRLVFTVGEERFDYWEFDDW